MLRTDKPIYKVILVFNLLLIVAAVVLSVIALTGEGVTTARILGAIIKLAALLFAGFYIISGYHKDAAKYYKVYGILYMITIIFGTITCLNNIPSVICNILIVLGIAPLVYVKDLGKTKSLGICTVILLLQIVIAIFLWSNGIPTISKNNILMSLDLACLYGIMTYAKYLDKAERGTK